MKIGVLFCGYNSEDYVEDSLAAWVKRDDVVISAVSVPFLEYQNQDEVEDSTTEILYKYLEEDKIHYLVDSPKYIREHEARDLALDYLLTEGVDLIWLVDADEIYTSVDIEKIIENVKVNKKQWYKVPLKNFLFDKEHYLKEPFCPPRIFPVFFEHAELERVYWDNDFLYRDKNTGEELDYKTLPSSTIRQEFVWIDHYTWLSDKTGKRKVKYQMDHFGHCGYKWNEETNSIEFNEYFYEKNGLKKPEVCSIV